jgi:hypothetical protein
MQDSQAVLLNIQGSSRNPRWHDPTRGFEMPKKKEQRPYFISPYDTVAIAKWGHPKPRPKRDWFPSKREYDS